eukprot:COSAG02_NODE_47399_length_341_cov_0.938017_1_plen_22_part_01
MRMDIPGTKSNGFEAVSFHHNT